MNQMKPPNSRKELEIFCGFINYLSKFIPHYFDLLQPLYLLKKQRHFSWTPLCDVAFRNIISAVNEATLLRYPDYNEKFFLDTDANQVAISHVFYKSSRPLAFYSRALNNAERTIRRQIENF